MLTLQSLQQRPSVVRLPWGERADDKRDASGFKIFSTGEPGQAHVLAHRMLDQGRYGLGHELLGTWLDGRSGTGSEWVHLHWHMAVFELEVGRWMAAFSRFQGHILPAAATEDALTDAPSLLWRLALASAGSVTLPWESVRATALARMRGPSKPYVELHNILALAGAGDLASIDHWLHRTKFTSGSRAEALVARVAIGLRAYVAGDYARCAAMLVSALPHLGEAGGSRAQNQLFGQLEEVSRAKAGAHGFSFPFPKAA